MKPAQDRFSGNSFNYRRFRPAYPLPFIEEIIGLSNQRVNCLDCGTGSGQVAKVLSQYFDKVHAIDISEDQIRNSHQAANIHYSVSRAEKTDFPADSFDLITVAQAIHWFDFQTFFNEVLRITKDGGIIALWGYGLLRFNNSLDRHIDRFYEDVVGPYWDSERKHVESSYENIPFPFTEIKLKKHYCISKDFSLDEFTGYLSTWSAVNKFKLTEGYDPVKSLLEILKPIWGEKLPQRAEFQIFTRIGRIKKARK